MMRKKKNSTPGLVDYINHTQAILDHPPFEAASSMPTDYTPPPRSEPASSPSSSGDKSENKSSKGGKDPLDVDLSSLF